MPIYKSSFEIAASAERVWKVLTDLDRYGEWNPQIPVAKGTVKEGAEIKIKLALPGRPAINLSATIEQAQENALFSWRGHLLAPWFFEGYREFAIQQTAPERVTVTHVEDVHGAFAPVFSLVMGKPVEKSQLALNDALRSRAEG